MKEPFNTLPINTNAGELILSSPYGSPSEVISTIMTYNVINGTYDDIYRDLKNKNGKEPDLEQWKEIAEEIKQELKLNYLFGGQHGFIQEAIDYAINVNDEELENDLRNVTPPVPEFIPGSSLTNETESKNKLQSGKKRKKNKDQRKARRTNRKKK